MTPQRSPAPADHPEPLGDVLANGFAIAAWAGMLTGLGELAYLALRTFVLHLLLFQGGDGATVWLAPLSNAALFVALFAGLIGAGRWWSRLRRSSTLAGIAVFLLVLSGLLLYPRLHPVASVVLAAGVGRQAASLWPRFGAALTRAARRTAPWAVAGFVLLGVGMTGVARWQERRAERRLGPPPGGPNVLLVILDTVRAWDLGLYGSARPTTPNLDRWAQGGVRFAQAFSTAPWTLPSHASVFTGLDAHRLAASWQTPLEDGPPTLAEVMRQHGFRTGGFVANLPYVGRPTGLGRGFLHYEDDVLSPGRLALSPILLRSLLAPRAVRTWLIDGDLVDRRRASDIVGRFLRWLDADPSRPFFAFLNLYDAHVPYVPPAEYRARFQTPGVPLKVNLLREEVAPDYRWSSAELQGLHDAYDGAIGYLDAQLGNLMEALARRGLDRRTLVVVTSDHGEEFAEHEVILHGNSLYRGALQVPLAMVLPGRVPAGAVVATPVSLRDLAATILDLEGLPPSGLGGRSLAPLWAGDSATVPVFSSVRHASGWPSWYPVSTGDLESVLWRGYRLIRDGRGREALYDARADTLERTDLAPRGEYAGLLHELRAVLDSAVGAPAVGADR